MKRVWMLLALGLLSSWAPAAQDQPNPEQLKKLYEDALVQLRSAQDRKNELAGQNEQLLAKIAELEQQLAQLKKEQSGYAERTLFLRAHHVAWQKFLHDRPLLQIEWDDFLAYEPAAVPGFSLSLFRGWPMGL
jgi:DNA repair exonuclease SbcCD ATPase subunit